MSDLPSFMEVPGVPGGRVATSALSPEVLQRIQDAQAGGFQIPAPVAPMPTPTDLGNMKPALNTGSAGLDAISGARSAGFSLPVAAPPQITATDLGNMTAAQRAALPPEVIQRAMNPSPEAPPFSAAATAAPVPPTGSTPPAGPSSGPMGALTQASMGVSARIPGAMPSFPGIGTGGEKDFRKAFEDKAKADEAAAEAGRATAIQAAALQDENAKQNEALMARSAQRETERQKYADEQLGHLKSAESELQKPGQTVDPDRYWKNKSTGQKVLAGIAVFLSGLGNGLMGKNGNDALSFIQKQVDDDIDAQKMAATDEKERRRDAVTGATNVYRMMLDKGMDERQAEAASRALAAQGLEMKLKALESKSKVDSYTAGIQQLRAANQISLQKSLDDLRTSSTTRFSSMAGGQAALMNAQTNRLEAGIKAATGKAGPNVPGTQAQSIGTANAAIKALKDLRDAHKSKTGMLSFAKQYLPGTSEAQYGDMASATTQIVGSYLEGGKLSDQDKLYYKSLFPSPTDGRERADAKTATLIRLIESNKDEGLKGLGEAGYQTGGFPESTQQKRDKYGAVGH